MEGLKFSGRVQQERTAKPAVRKPSEEPGYIETSQGRMEIVWESVPAAELERQVLSRGSSEQELTDKEATAILYNKLWRIVIPKVAFQQARLPDVIAYLRGESARVDVNPGLISPGIDLSLQRRTSEVRNATTPGSGETETSFTPPPASPAEPLVNMSGDNVRLMDVLHAVVSATNWQLKVGPRGVRLIEPARVATIPSGILTEEFRVPPEFVDLLQQCDPLVPPDPAPDTANGSSCAVHRSRPQVYLEAQGMHFEPGMAAVYLAATSKLVVRNTPENLARAESVVERLWNQSASQRPSIKLNHEPELFCPTSP